jgi:DNA-binding transcriptional LysR family regulator
MESLHHLMLFYYVAKHGGITPALKHIPYGIQQPALSAQLLQLESRLGQRLFIRRPFALTPAGEKLYAHAKVFFDPLPELLAEIRAAPAPALRLGSGTYIEATYLPAGINALKTLDPELNIKVKTGSTDDLLQGLREERIDAAIVGVDLMPKGLCYRKLITVPLVLLAPQGDPAWTPPNLTRPGIINAPLVAMDRNEGLSQIFWRVLEKRKIVWNSTLSSATLDTLSRFVAEKQGFAVGLKVPGQSVPPGVVAHPLRGFRPVTVVVAWRKSDSKRVEAFLEVVKLVMQQIEVPGPGAGRKRESGEGGRRKSEAGGRKAEAGEKEERERLLGQAR